MHFKNKLVIIVTKQCTYIIYACTKTVMIRLEQGGQQYRFEERQHNLQSHSFWSKEIAVYIEACNWILSLTMH